MTYIFSTSYPAPIVALLLEYSMSRLFFRPTMKQFTVSWVYTSLSVARYLRYWIVPRGTRVAPAPVEQIAITVNGGDNINDFDQEEENAEACLFEVRYLCFYSMSFELPHG